MLGGHCGFVRGFWWGCLGPRPARPGRRANAQGQAELCGSCWFSTGLGAGGRVRFMASFDKADAGATFLQQPSQCLARTDTGSLWLGSKGKESRAAHAEVLLSPSIPESFRLLPTPPLSVSAAWELGVGCFLWAEPLMEGAGTQEGETRGLRLGGYSWWRWGSPTQICSSTHGRSQERRRGQGRRRGRTQ